MTRLGLEVDVARPAAGDVLDGEGVPAKSVREGFVRVGRCVELFGLLVEGVEVILVVFV